MHGHAPWEARGHHHMFVIRCYLPWDLRLTNLSRLTGQQAPPLQDYYLLPLELHTCVTMPGVLHGCWRLTSDPCTCVASSSLTELSS